MSVSSVTISAASKARSPRNSAAERRSRRPARRATRLRFPEGSGCCSHRDAGAAHGETCQGQAEVSKQKEQISEVVWPRSDARVDARGDEGHQAQEGRFSHQVANLAELSKTCPACASSCVAFSSASSHSFSDQFLGIGSVDDAWRRGHQSFWVRAPRTARPCRPGSRNGPGEERDAGRVLTAATRPFRRAKVTQRVRPHLKSAISSLARARRTAQWSPPT